MSGRVEIFRSLAEVPAGFGPSAVTVGNFDGVHLGHREILSAVAEDARILKDRGAAVIRAVAVTFDPHPEQVLRPGRAPKLLTPIAERGRLLAAAGIAPV